jgi:hypothetical protein
MGQMGKQTTEVIIHQTADAIAAELLDREYTPGSDEWWISATKVLARFYVHGLEQEERHRIIYDLAPAAMLRMREQRREFSETILS